MSAAGPPFTGAIAFYLPQFHPIAENDAWWGKGFTEWTNVTRARSLFEGHCQPRLPADLGFYDLRLPEVMAQQAALAREYGIRAFCYHYYWFKGGRRLLERPLEQMLASGRPDFPFCLCWANENWTRRWDGLEREVLMPQEHDADSDIAFLHSVLPYFDDPRYLRVRGRPLLVVYRATLFPDLRATVDRWQAESARLGRPAPYLVAAESFDVSAQLAAAAGFDATCEFPPHGAAPAILPRSQWPRLPDAFAGSITDYEKMAAHFLSREDGPLRRFKGVTLNWDNTARKKQAANVTVGFSVAGYHRWLAGAIAHSRRTAPADEQLVFINAWNEWGEGTYLEPDQLHGRAYLEATHAAITGQPYGRKAPGGPVPEIIEASPVTAGCPATVAPAPASRERIVAISMVGNEADIIETFVRENLRLVDEMLIACHCPFDGTAEILERLAAEGLPIRIRTIDTPEFRKVETLRPMIREAIEDHGASWVLPLDADEFLDVADRPTLDRELAAHRDSHVWISWINHVPTALDDPHEPNPLRRIRHRYAYATPSPEENVWVWKVILNAALTGPYQDRYDLAKGAHRLVFRGTNQVASQPITVAEGIGLRHFAVRSVEQLAMKVGIGRLRRDLASGVEAQGGVHWDAMWPDLFAGDEGLATIQRAVRQYLDAARLSPDEVGDVPVIADPMQATCELRYTNLQVPAVAAVIRWVTDVVGRNPPRS